jgi:antitoxin ParD1/3/4
LGALGQTGNEPVDRPRDLRYQTLIPEVARMGGRNFSLTRRLSEFVDHEVASGRHQNASDVVREALRRYEDDLEAERASLEAIAAIASEGRAAIARGDFRLVRGPGDAQALVEELQGHAQPGLARRRSTR